MNRIRLKQTAAAGLTCAIVASVIGIATGAAAPFNDDDSSGLNGTEAETLPGPPPIGAAISLRRGALEGDGRRVISGPPVHSELVVPTRSGDDFETVTQDSGTVKSVSGDQLTITEGTEEATYRTVTIEIPDDAKVLRNGEQVELGDLKEGDRVHVSRSPDDSFVFATDEEFFEKAIHRFRDLPRPPRAGGLMPGLPPTPWPRRGN